jgi:hypothetical protein
LHAAAASVKKKLRLILRPAIGLLRRWPPGTAMPSLVRFLVVCLVLAALVGGVMFALATFVQPTPSETTIRLPPERLLPAQ